MMDRTRHLSLKAQYYYLGEGSGLPSSSGKRVVQINRKEQIIIASFDDDSSGVRDT